VFPVLAQELGFIGAIVVFVLFMALLWRILACAWRSRDPFGTMFGAGLASALLFQVFVNVGMGIGILPVTGIPLPFISHGGASLISVAIGLGIIQSINIRNQHRAEW
jgi:rod shape determining protein RodA